MRKSLGLKDLQEITEGSPSLRTAYTSSWRCKSMLIPGLQRQTDRVKVPALPPARSLTLRCRTSVSSFKKISLKIFLSSETSGEDYMKECLLIPTRLYISLEKGERSLSIYSKILYGATTVCWTQEVSSSRMLSFPIVTSFMLDMHLIFQYTCCINQMKFSHFDF